MKSKGNNQNSTLASPIHIVMKLDKQLKALLREHDVTVTQLSRKAGVSAKTIYNWLEGQRPKDIGAVKKIADHFAVTVDFLCFGIEPPTLATEIERRMDEINAGVFEVILRRIKK